MKTFSVDTIPATDVEPELFSVRMAEPGKNPVRCRMCFRTKAEAVAAAALFAGPFPDGGFTSAHVDAMQVAIAAGVVVPPCG